MNGDTSANLTTLPTLVTTATASSPVGTYPITASGAGDSDYSISYVAGTLTVANAVLDHHRRTTRPSSTARLCRPLPRSYSGFVNGDTSASLTTQPTADHDCHCQ